MKAKIHNAQIVYEYEKSYDKHMNLSSFDEHQAYYFRHALVKPYCVGIIQHGVGFKLIVIGE